MKANRSSPLRAGVLFLALAGIGSTGCLTMALIDSIDKKTSGWRADREESQLDRRIAQLSPRAQAGDPAAMTMMAFYLFQRGDRTFDDNAAREVALLERAAEAGDGHAQAVLGMALSGQGMFDSVSRRLPSALQDRPRAIAWLQRATTQACWINSNPERKTNSYGPDFIDPALNASYVLQKVGRTDESLLWFARDILHCGQTDVSLPRGWLAGSGMKGAQLDSAVAPLYLLAGVRLYIDEMKASMTPEAFATAERDAAELRRRVAASESEYPAPRTKELR